MEGHILGLQQDTLWCQQGEVELYTPYNRENLVVAAQFTTITRRVNSI